MNSPLCRSAAAPVLIAIALALAAGSASAVEPSVGVHETKWFVHEDLITGPRPLSFYEGIIAAATADATALVRGDNGPADSACCMGYSDVSVATFSNSGGLDLLEIDSAAEFSELNNLGGTGSRAFLVQQLNFCGDPGSPIGCATTPSCGFEPANIVMAIGMDAYDDFFGLASTYAHEAGHNSCLTHVGGNICSLMSASSGGGCLSSSECADALDDTESVSGTCDCYSDASTYKADGTMCSEVAMGVCSGGLCAADTTEAGVRLFAAAGTDMIIGGTTDDPLLMSGAPGGWTDLGEFPSGQVLTGTAYGDSRSTLYGVGDTDQLYTIDEETGVTTLVGTVSGIDAGDSLHALAWDPGPTAAESDDRLFALDTDGTFNSLYEIDPDTVAATKLGNIGIGSGTGGGFSGLAYDYVNGVLYAAPSFNSGLYSLQFSGCGGSCSATEINDTAAPGSYNKFVPSLAYSATSGSVYHMGYQSGPRTEYDTYLASDLALGTVTRTVETRGLDGFTTGGLAVVPQPVTGGAVPVASLGAGLVAAAGLLWAARRRLRA